MMEIYYLLKPIILVCLYEGELASTCAKANGVKATVIYGSVRDLDALYYMDYPIFACDYAPNAGSALGLGEINVDISVGDMTIQP